MNYREQRNVFSVFSNLGLQLNQMKILTADIMHQHLL